MIDDVPDPASDDVFGLRGALFRVAFFFGGGFSSGAGSGARSRLGSTGSGSGLGSGLSSFGGWGGGAGGLGGAKNSLYSSSVGATRHFLLISLTHFSYESISLNSAHRRGSRRFLIKKPFQERINPIVTS
tara:strand:+ start:4034 stop:4423 length:390 start_codon:yes stop_codon:yes gene_type:complete